MVGDHPDVQWPGRTDTARTGSPTGRWWRLRNIDLEAIADAKRRLAAEGRVYVHYRDGALIKGGEHVPTHPDPAQIKLIGLRRTSSDPIRTYWIYSLAAAGSLKFSRALCSAQIGPQSAHKLMAPAPAAAQLNVHLASQRAEWLAC